MTDFIGFIVGPGAIILAFMLGFRRARKQTTQLRQWLEVIRDGATDERISRDTVRRCAVDALEGKTWPVHKLTPP